MCQRATTMQQRRPHSAVSIADRNGDSSGILFRQESSSRPEPAKERRGANRYKVVKHGTKFKRSTCERVKSNPHVRVAMLSFGLFSFFVGVAIVKNLHHGDGLGYGVTGRRRQIFHKHKNVEPREDEYNSDNFGEDGLLSKLRGGYAKYVIPESMEKIGSKAKWYTTLRQEYDTNILPKDDERSLKFVEAERMRKGGAYQQSPQANTPYDIYNCPDHPSEGYPMQWPVLDVLHNWPADDTTPQEKRPTIFQGLCVFDYRTELHKAKNYRKKERPFVVRDDPAVARTVERWNYPGYMEKLLMGEEDTMRRAEYSPNNHFMYWKDEHTWKERREAKKEFKEEKKKSSNAHDGFGRGDQEEMAEVIHQVENLSELKRKLQDAEEYLEEHQDDDDAQDEVYELQRQMGEAKTKTKNKRDVMKTWQPPTENLRMTYLEWLEHANVTENKLGPDNPHWYFRLIGCGGDQSKVRKSCDRGSSEWLFDELTFFQPRMGKDVERPFYLVEPRLQKGIHCRFGMKGVIAENHFDIGRNSIALLSGQRRYILAHPNQCTNMNLLPQGHPSARHSAVDWSDPDLENFPTFPKAHVNEIVMQAGDVLYLPTGWFHYIISLELNMQCNTRSGGEYTYRDEITECGFMGGK